MLRWPQSMQLQLLEKGRIRDIQLAEVYLMIPGLAGTPHIDPQAKPYSWTCPVAVSQHKLVQAAAMVAAGIQPGTTFMRGSDGRGSPEAAAAAAIGGGDAGVQLGTSGQRSTAQGLTVVYPAGVVFVRCGWVADTGVEAIGDTVRPFQTAGGVSATVSAAAVIAGLEGGGDGGEVSVQLRIQPRAAEEAAGIQQQRKQKDQRSSGPGSAGGSPSKQQHAAAGAIGREVYAASGRQGPARDEAMSVYGNPLAAGDRGLEDIEVGLRVMPPLPHLPSDRALHRAAMGDKVRTAAC
jgi:hypothetical protein